MAASSAYLLDQASEVHHTIFSLVDPKDLAHLSQTCRQLRDAIAQDNLLWKNHYLKHFDRPASQIEIHGADETWQPRLKDLMRVERLLKSNDASIKDETALVQVYETVMDLIVDSTEQPIQNADYMASHFTNEANISAFLCRSSLFASTRYQSDTPASSFDLQQLSAKLFVYYGLEIEPSSSDILADTAKSVHPYARSRLYDLRRYNDRNQWGPFLDDGSEGTDWEKVQCILIDLLYNLRTYTDRRGSSSPSSNSSAPSSQLWDHPFRGLAPNSYKSTSLSGTLATDPNPTLTAQDPYGVTGTWMRIVCFLDYNDLYAFNFDNIPIPLSEDRPPIETREAFRLIRLHLRVTKIEYDDEARGKAIGTPVVYFEGKSKSTYMAWDPNANSSIRGECWDTVGSVRTTPSGDIRWTTFSIFHGDERWRSEGVQIGGIRSARGILGNWFDKDYEPHGPAGPTCFWKVSDDILEEKKPRELMSYHWAQEVVSVLVE